MTCRIFACYQTIDMDVDELFQTFNHGHHDLVLAADYNFYGNRLVTAAADHRLKVWDKTGDDWKLIDSWKAHDAEITDVRAAHSHNLRRCVPRSLFPKIHP